MELLCPECLGALATLNGQTARCTVHGGEFRILFSRCQPPAPPVIEPAQTGASAMDADGQPAFARSASAPQVQLVPVAGTMCPQHPNVPAVVTCQVCTRPMCITCAFQTDDGAQLCFDCVSRQSARRSGAAGSAQASATVVAAIPPDANCVQHPHLRAAAKCQSCGAFMCATCDFLLPGGIHVCPACATSPKTKLSSKRRKLVGWSYALAVWSTLVLAALMAGAFAGMAGDKSGEEALGVLLSLLLFIPSLVGTALGTGAIERRLANPPAIWIAASWNGLILGGFLLLCVIGLFSS